VSRDILLIEPAYKNKYPPLGLMKTSAYHKLLGDNVKFFKGKSKELKEYKWDRIYITTLFTFDWNITIDTINFYKRSVNKTKHFYIGGIMASLMPEEIYKYTGIRPLIGLLDKPKCLDDDNDIIIDSQTPDYDILDEINYKYPANNSYISYTTRGCIRKCSFCAVPQLEPQFVNYISIKEQITEIDTKYGRKKNLLLLDNNVLASNNFTQIIDDIKNIGFYKGAKYQEPILFNLLMRRLHLGEKSPKIIEKISILLKNQPSHIKSDNRKNEFLGVLDKYNLIEDIKLENVLDAEKEIAPYFERYRNKAYAFRYVDFNQGIDPRLITEEKMELLSEISIAPLRIAFDSLEPEYKEKYINAIRLASKYGIRNLSNYILYNWNDTPDDFYERLKINIELNDTLNVKIYSFPMKYIPITYKNRNYIDKKHWNLKYIRAIQKILLVTGGSVMPGKSFFEKAFGVNKKEFHKIMLMPEDYIIYRFKHEENGNTEKWWTMLNNLDRDDYNEALDIIKTKDFSNIEQKTDNKKVIEVLGHYYRSIPLT